MSATENKRVIRRWIEEGWNAGHLDVADELYAEDFFAPSMEEGAPDLHGPEGAKAMVQRLRSTFPDVRFHIDHLVAEGDTVVGAFTIEGTHLGELHGIPPTGRRVKFAAIDVWRFESGRIVERQAAVVDVFSMLGQLGIGPKVE
ncbi:MAG: ester cyclase [Candidatus Eisenbacteria bacterium]